MSRGLNLLRDHGERIQLWLNGPPFLRYAEQWPQFHKIDTDALDVVHIAYQPLETTGASHMVTTPKLTLMDRSINRHSALNALCRDVAILNIFEKPKVPY